MQSRYLTTAAAAVLFAAVPLSGAQAQVAQQDSVRADGGFVRHAIVDNLLEVRLGELAQHRASQERVRKFGERMENEHGKLQEQWADLAKKHGLTVAAPKLGPTQQQKLDRLEKVDKSAFDRDYMTAMIRGHSEDVAALKGEVDSAHSEAVKKMAAYELPIVQDHLLAARAAGKEVGVDSAVVAESQKVAEGK
jgi:putative membrane protein